jgi:hypothetical protein
MQGRNAPFLTPWHANKIFGTARLYLWKKNFDINAEDFCIIPIDMDSKITQSKEFLKTVENLLSAFAERIGGHPTLTTNVVYDFPSAEVAEMVKEKVLEMVDKETTASLDFCKKLSGSTLATGWTVLNCKLVGDYNKTVQFILQGASRYPPYTIQVKAFEMNSIGLQDASNSNLDELAQEINRYLKNI